MSDQLQLRVITPHRSLLDESVREVSAPGTLGEFGVLPDHAAFLSSLEIGRLTYKTARGAHHLAIREGFAEVADNVMTVLVERALPASEIDRAAAREELAAAEDQLERLSSYDPAWAEADATRRWAQARLEVAGK